jgi:hypothetical protein
MTYDYYNRWREMRFTLCLHMIDQLNQIELIQFIRELKNREFEKL